MNIFEKAVRNKFRFETKAGLLNVEQLWDLPLTSKSGANLDDIAVALHQEAQSSNMSFVKKATPAVSLARDKLDVVLHIIGQKQAEADARSQKAAIESRRQAIEEAIEVKKQQQLHTMSLEELQAQLDSLK